MIKLFPRRFLINSAELVSGRKKYSYYQKVRIVPYLAFEELCKIQRDKLRNILYHAYNYSPYYNELFESNNLKPDDIGSPEDLKNLPILTKSIIRERFEDIKVRLGHKHKINAYPNHTGGSTGQPITFLHSNDYYTRGQAYALRSWEWGGWYPGSRLLNVWGAPQEISAAHSFKGKISNWVQNIKLFDAFDLSASKIESFKKIMETFRPEFINGYASSLYFIAYEMNKQRKTFSDVKSVFTTAEKLRPYQRKEIEEVFLCKVYDTYGSREVFSIASECRLGKMHIHMDSVVLESVPESPELNKLIVTCLDNFVFPFIRYEIGDYGRLCEEKCSCGNNFASMSINIGRMSDNFLLQTGRVVHGEYFTHLLYGIDGIARFQFHQKPDKEIELLVVPAKEVDIENLKRILEELSFQAERELGLGGGFFVRIVDKIETTTTGKHMFTISDVII
jgi:phenylacetate-CoA ligase